MMDGTCRTNMRKAILLCWGAWTFCAGANLQPRDLLFISVHRNPTKVVSDDKVAFVLTEGGVLQYDYRRGQWMDNVAPGMGIQDIAYHPDKNQLLMLTSAGGTLEYNPAFRRVSPSITPFQAASAGSAAGELSGLSLGGDFTFLGDAVRDRWNRRAPVGSALVFDYDHLWLLTTGHGPFLGSVRRKEAASLWFGFYDPSITAMAGTGKDLWFGSPNSAGALVRAKVDLSEWSVYAAQQDYEFPDGFIYDIAAWRDCLWLATAKGVVRRDASGHFRLYRRLLGSADLIVYRLFAHGDRLYAGTEKGAAALDAPEAEFRAAELPVNIAPAVWDFCESEKDLWAATRYGLFVERKDGWKSFKDVTKEDVPEGYGVNVAAVAYKDTVLYWADDSRIFEKRRGRKPKVVQELPRVFRLVFDGDMLYAGFEGGVRAYDVKTRLWTDFRLEDGIPGRKAQCFLVRDGILWIGTDLGVMRVILRPYLP